MNRSAGTWLAGGLMVGASFFLSLNGCSPASPPAPSYTLTASAFIPAEITDSNSASSTITITPANGPGNGYAGIVELTCNVQSASSDLNCSFSVNPIVISTHSPVTSTMTVSAQPTAPAAVYSIVVSGVDASKVAPSNGAQQLSITVM